MRNARLEVTLTNQTGQSLSAPLRALRTVLEAMETPYDVDIEIRNVTVEHTADLIQLARMEQEVNA